MGGKGSGFQAIGNIGDKRRRLKLQSPPSLNVEPLRSFCEPPSVIRSYRGEDSEDLVPFLNIIRNHFCELLLLHIGQITLKAL
jgi:hypothetical protein